MCYDVANFSGDLSKVNTTKQSTKSIPLIWAANLHKSSAKRLTNLSLSLMCKIVIIPILPTDTWMYKSVILVLKQSYSHLNTITMPEVMPGSNTDPI